MAMSFMFCRYFSQLRFTERMLQPPRLPTLTVPALSVADEAFIYRLSSISLPLLEAAMALVSPRRG